MSANQKCYDDCSTHLDHNSWGGCRPGLDCPWYPSKLGEAHCESSANFAGVYSIHETAEICCQEHFGGTNIATCVGNSMADVEAEQQKVLDLLARNRYFWPDLYGKKNCVFDSGYDEWMEGAVCSSFGTLSTLSSPVIRTHIPFLYSAAISVVSVR